MTITGTRFGVSGFVEACPANDGNDPCVQAQTIPGGWNYGYNNTIQVLLNIASLVTGIPYCVQVTAQYSQFIGAPTLTNLCAAKLVVLPAAAVSLVVQDALGNTVPQVSIYWPEPDPSGHYQNARTGETPLFAPRNNNINGPPLSQSGCLYIDKTPSMPQIAAQLRSSDGSALSGLVKWGESVLFMNNYGDKANNIWTQRPLNFVYPDQCIPSYGGPFPLPQTSDASQQVKIDWCGGGFLAGGQATVTATWQSQTFTYSFCVLGTNPDQSTVNSLLSPQTGQPAFWFENNVAIHETKQSQFCDNTSRTAGGDYCKFTNSYGAGMPIWGYPNGYGLLQTDPPPTMNSIWSWQAGIAAWEALTQQKAGPLVYNPQSYDPHLEYPFWLKQANDWAQYNLDNPGGAVAAPENVTTFGPQGTPAPPNSLPGCHFETNLIPGTKVSSPNIPGVSPSNDPGKIYWFGDAELMKSLGGAPVNYVSWNDSTPPYYWSFQPANSVSPNIVYSFCTCNAIAGCQQ
jgi:hypothetical protein